MRRGAWRFLVLGLALFLAAQIWVGATGLGSARERKPMESWLMGSQAVLVDYLWFDLLQYFGAYSLGEHDLSGFPGRYERLHRLAPTFHRATIFASAVRSSDMQDPKGALFWLEQAESDNPEHWVYPYEQGFIHYLWLENYRQAEAAFRRAGRREGAHPAWRHFVARIHELGGDPRVACELWLQIAENAEHPRIREAAMRNVERLEGILHSRSRASSGPGA